MTDETPDSQVALVATDRPVAISVVPIEDDRTPEGMVCLGTSLEGRLVARCVVPPEAAAFLEDRELFVDPVRLVLAARAAPPGLQCRLFALVPLPEGAFEEDDEQEEPWASSVPSSDFDRLIRPSQDAEAPRAVAVLLGHVVRFTDDRRFPDHLAREAADVLATIVAGRVSEVVDKVLGDLLGP
jgi:hypothetical protein